MKVKYMLRAATASITAGLMLMTPFATTASMTVHPYEPEFGWMYEIASSVENYYYWYENNIRQGTYDDPNGVIGDGTVRGREIYDPESDGWYWLDACRNGAMATNKEVWMPYIYQDEKTWDEEELKKNAASSGDMADQVLDYMRKGLGKWVRYSGGGKMIKGWYTVEPDTYDADLYPNQVGNTYYYDPMTGLMAKGEVEIEGKIYVFDEVDGRLLKTKLTTDKEYVTKYFLTSMVNPLTFADVDYFTYEFDKYGNVISYSQTASDRTYTATYDEYGRRISSRCYDRGKPISNIYNYLYLPGEEMFNIFHEFYSSDCEYNLKGDITRELFYSGDDVWETHEYTYYYDADGNEIIFVDYGKFSATFDKNGNPSAFESGSYRMRAEYDSNGILIKAYSTNKFGMFGQQMTALVNYYYPDGRIKEQVYSTEVRDYNREYVDHTVVYEYDGQNRLVATRNSAYGDTIYSYPDKNTMDIDSPSSGHVHWVIDDNGNPVSATTQMGDVYTFTFMPVQVAK